MCKILTVAGITEETSEQAWKFIKKMAKEMSFQNNNGLGYAAVDDHGKLYAERWLYNSDAFDDDNRKPFTDLEWQTLNKFKGMLRKNQKYNCFGKKLIDESKLRSITLHARMATSGREFYNTHPFIDVKTQTSLIHNGVIHNAEKIGLHQSTCDSEAILNLYTTYEVMNKPEAIQDVVDELEGYFACGVLSKMQDGTVILDLFRDDSAQLSAAFIDELNTVVFSTSSIDITTACSSERLTLSSSFEVASNTMLRLNALTGDVMGVYKFKKKAYTGMGTTTYNYDKWNEHRRNNTSHYSSRTEYEQEDENLKYERTLKNMDVMNDKTKQLGPGITGDEDWVCDKTTGKWTKISTIQNVVGSNES
jgi:hypothetical protein